MLDNVRQGILAAVSAFVLWGFMPFYFHAFPSSVGAFETTLHRIAWSLPVIALFLLLNGSFANALRLFRRPKTIAILFASMVLISINWLVYGWSAMNGHLAEASLGYFINPILNVVLGVLLLRERLNKWRWLAIILASIGVLNQMIIVGEPPWIALILALSFGTYGLLRKTVQADAGAGLFVETLLLAPFIIGAIIWLEIHGGGHFVSGPLSITALLLFGGVTIVTPLTLFSFAARRIAFSTLGIIQYIAPSMVFIIALSFGETLTLGALMTFGFIWAGLALYTFDLWRKRAAQTK